MRLMNVSKVQCVRLLVVGGVIVGVAVIGIDKARSTMPVFLLPRHGVVVVAVIIVRTYDAIIVVVVIIFFKFSLLLLLSQFLL